MHKKNLFLFECKFCLDNHQGNQICYLLQYQKDEPCYCPVTELAAEWRFKGEKRFEFSD